MPDLNLKGKLDISQEGERERAEVGMHRWWKGSMLPHCVHHGWTSASDTAAQGSNRDGEFLPEGEEIDHGRSLIILGLNWPISRRFSDQVHLKWQKLVDFYNCQVEGKRLGTWRVKYPLHMLFFLLALSYWVERKHPCCPHPGEETTAHISLGKALHWHDHIYFIIQTRPLLRVKGSAINTYAGTAGINQDCCRQIGHTFLSLRAKINE